MKKIINKIEPIATTCSDRVSRMTIEFYFESHPKEFRVIKTTSWLRILDNAKKSASHVSWNELKNLIYLEVITCSIKENNLTPVYQ